MTISICHHLYSCLARPSQCCQHLSPALHPIDCAHPPCVRITHADSLTRDMTPTRLMRKTVPPAISSLRMITRAFFNRGGREMHSSLKHRVRASGRQRQGGLRHDQQAGRHVTSSHGHDTAAWRKRCGRARLWTTLSRRARAAWRRSRLAARTA